MSDTVPPGGGDSEGGKDPDVTGHGDLHGTQGGEQITKSLAMLTDW